MKLERFGIEIRKIGTVTALYEDVDKILQNHDVNVKRQTVAHALQKMLKPGNWLNVCSIKECAKVANVYIEQERMDIYRAVHCVNWNEMTDEYRQLIMAMVLDDFRCVLNPKEEIE